MIDSKNISFQVNILKNSTYKYSLRDLKHQVTQDYSRYWIVQKKIRKPPLRITYLNMLDKEALLT